MYELSSSQLDQYFLTLQAETVVPANFQSLHSRPKHHIPAEHENRHFQDHFGIVSAVQSTCFLRFRIQCSLAIPGS